MNIQFKVIYKARFGVRHQSFSAFINVCQLGALKQESKAPNYAALCALLFKYENIKHNASKINLIGGQCFSEGTCYVHKGRKHAS